jgi:hypothetical protein
MRTLSPAQYVGSATFVRVPEQRREYTVPNRNGDTTGGLDRVALQPTHPS